MCRGESALGIPAAASRESHSPRPATLVSVCERPQIKSVHDGDDEPGADSSAQDMDGASSPTSKPQVGAGRSLSRVLVSRLGLQRQLMLAFTLLLIAGVASASWLLLHRSRDTLADILGEQARQIAQTLAMAAQAPYETHGTAQLEQLGRDLLRSRNIVLVVFYDASGKPIATSCRDPDLMSRHGSEAGPYHLNPQELMKVQSRSEPSLGAFLQVTAPVFDSMGDGRGGNTRLLGYLTVGISQNSEQAQMQRVILISIALGCLLVVLSLPLASAMIHRIFQPIRQLVAATDRIAAGYYDTRVVATGRKDEIGMLARSFNEMVQRIREHREALKVANEQLAEANRGLEQKVAIRTEELASSNRRLSAEIAEKEDFLRAVSHDLNAPLRNIGGMAAMLLMKHREKFEEDVIHRLERIQKNVQVETDLIAELLELSRIKTRRQKHESVDLDALVRELTDVFDEDLKQRRISLTVEGKLPVMTCERARLRQVFQNLIDNAIKYMGDGPTREIRVSCRDRGDEAEFCVRDTGIGIEPEDLDKVFYVFRRGKTAAERNISGKGVGLASVKSIIETYGGRIWVESEPGKGCAFRFTIRRDAMPRQASGEDPAVAA